MVSCAQRQKYFCTAKTAEFEVRNWGAKAEHLLFLLLFFFDSSHVGAVNVHEKVTVISNGSNNSGLAAGV